VLIEIECRRFTRRAHRHDPVDGGFALSLNQSLERGFVHSAAFERRDNSSISSGKHNGLLDVAG
jgi:hypothetical protein